MSLKPLVSAEIAARNRKVLMGLLAMVALLVVLSVVTVIVKH